MRSWQTFFLIPARFGFLGLERAADLQIWEYARKEGFVIVTLDADFYELSLLHDSPPKLLWLRFGNQPTDTIVRLLRQRLPEIMDFVYDNETTCMQIY